MAWFALLSSGEVEPMVEAPLISIKRVISLSVIYFADTPDNSWCASDPGIAMALNRLPLSVQWMTRRDAPATLRHCYHGRH
jgi:hypothetical protein